MKAKLLLVALLSFTVYQANALFVDSPDSNFRKFSCVTRHVKVYTMEGVLVLANTVQNNRLEIGSLSKGIYFLGLNTANGQGKSVKLVKE